MTVVWRQWIEGFEAETEESGCTVTIDTAGLGFDKNKLTSTIASASDTGDQATAEVTNAAWLPSGSEGRLRFKFKPLAVWDALGNAVFARLDNADPVQLIELFSEADEESGAFSQANTLRSTSLAATALAPTTVVDTEYTFEVAWRGATDSTGFRRVWIDETLVSEFTSLDMVNADDCDVSKLYLGWHHYDGVAISGLSCEIRWAQLSDDADETLTDPEVTFPTTSVLTGFDGGAENPLSEGGNWSGPILTGRNQWQLANNRAESTSGSTCQSYWTPDTFTEQEVFATIARKATTNGQWFDLCARVVAPNTAGVDMYELEITLAAGADTWDLYRIINGTGTLIDSFTAAEVAVGDQVGLEVSGTGSVVTLNAYHKPSVGSWTLMGTFEDTDANRIVSAGNIGIETSNGSLWALDEFGGGEVVSPATGIEFTRFVGPVQVPGTPTTFYTVPTGFRARVLHIHVSNPDSEGDLEMYIGTEGGGWGNDDQVYEAFDIPGNDVWDAYDPYDLAAGESIAFGQSPIPLEAMIVTVSGYVVPE